MVINTQTKASKVHKAISEDLGIKMANTFLAFYNAYEVFSKKMVEKGFHTSLGIDENIFVGDDNVALTIMCFKNTDILVRAYPLWEMSLRKSFDVNDESGNDIDPFYQEICKDFENMCNIL